MHIKSGADPLFMRKKPTKPFRRKPSGISTESKRRIATFYFLSENYSAFQAFLASPLFPEISEPETLRRLTLPFLAETGHDQNNDRHNIRNHANKIGHIIGNFKA